MFFILGSISMLFTKDINVKTNDYELQIKERQFLSLTDPKQISFQEGEDNKIISLESFPWIFLWPIHQSICPNTGFFASDRLQSLPRGIRKSRQ